MLPLRQLALLSHILLFALALETIIVYNIESLSDIRAHFSSKRAASTARARLSERKADTKRERQRLLLLAAASRDAGGEPATPSSSSNNNSARAPPGRRLPGALLSWGSMEISAIRRPWASRSAPSASLEASSLEALATLAEEERVGGNGGGDGENGSSSARRLRGGESGFKATAADGEKSAATTATGTTPYETTSDAAELACAAAEREETKRLAALDAEIQRGYHSWLSWCIDLSCAFVFSVTYVLAKVLIFTISSRRAPGIYKLAGVTATNCETALALERSEQNGV